MKKEERKEATQLLHFGPKLCVYSTTKRTRPMLARRGHKKGVVGGAVPQRLGVFCGGGDRASEGMTGRERRKFAKVCAKVQHMLPVHAWPRLLFLQRPTIQSLSQ